MEEKEEPTKNQNELFVKSIISDKVILDYDDVGKNYKDVQRQKIAQQVEGKCIADGYVKRGSVEVIESSAGIQESSFVEYQVTYQCDLCRPVEGMIIQCQTKSITQKAGIHAECLDKKVPFLSVFITRDDNLEHPEFANIKETGMTITAKIVGVSFEKNDATISVLANLI